MRIIDADELLTDPYFQDESIPERFLFIEAVEGAPTISPDSLVKRGRWDWREEWETHPETHSCDLINCGWYCTECGIELGDYLTKKIGQHVMLDDDFRKPKLARCPSCGALMED